MVTPESVVVPAIESWLPAPVSMMVPAPPERLFTVMPLMTVRLDPGVLRSSLP